MKRPAQLVETMNVVLKIIAIRSRPRPALEVYRDPSARLGSTSHEGMRGSASRMTSQRDIQRRRPRQTRSRAGAEMPVPANRTSGRAADRDFRPTHHRLDRLRLPATVKLESESELTVAT